jgi:hypothetical protein
MHSSLPAVLGDQLRDEGVIVLRSVLTETETLTVASAYDRAVREACADDISVGSTTTRVTDFVNRGAAFDKLYVNAMLLDACRLVLGVSFRLSSMHARTVHPHADAQRLHIDQPPDEDGFPLLGFIYTIDAFSHENGATRFLRRSQHDEDLDTTREVVDALAPAGSLIVFNGSIWHGHGANLTNLPRRSVQGAFTRRRDHPATDFRGRMSRETFDRLGARAKLLLGFD